MTLAPLNDGSELQRAEAATMTRDGASIALAICTCNRTTMLAKLHESLRNADLSRAACIVLVDNHASRNGLEYWNTLPDLGVRTIAVWQEHPGVASARNRAIMEARAAGVQIIAFVDDDEIIAPDWLNRLFEHQVQTGASVIGGPVLPLFSDIPSSWAVSSGFYEQKQPTYPDAPPVNSTANVLICLDALDGMAEPFNLAFGLSGGSDQVLFTTLYKAGVPMSWCQRAVVFEEVPQSRLAASWIHQRALRNGNINMRAAMYFASPSERRMLRAKYMLLLPLAIVLAAIRITLARCNLGNLREAELKYFKAKGRMQALFGSAYLEYASRHTA